MNSLILRTAAPLLLILLALYSMFVLWRGHYEPGGGFVGGLLLAGGIALYALSKDTGSARKVLRILPRTLLGLGLLVGVASGVAGLVAGHALFHPLWAGYIPGLGALGTVPLFAISVYLVVAGTAAEILLTLAEE
jgi:multicomponent Na+:H+ antiporter subunit B